MEPRYTVPWLGLGFALCNQGIALLFYLTFSQNSEIDCCRSAPPASPFLLSAPSALIHSWPHKGVLCVFSCGSGSCSTNVSCLFLSMRWFGGGNSGIFGELAPNCEVFDPTVFLHFLEGEFYSVCVFWTVGTVFKVCFSLNPVFLTHKTCSQNLCFSYLVFLTVTPWCIPSDLLKAWRFLK